MRSDEQADRTQVTGSPLGTAAEPRPGAVLAERYEVQARHSEDPIAIEYVAFDQETEKTVLLRVVRPDLLPRESDRREAFERVEATLGIAGRYLPGVSDVDLEGRLLFTVEPWPPGTSLRDVIETRAARGERLGPGEVLPVIARVAAAVRAIPFPLHHGEIRAERVYIDPERLRVTGPFLLAALPASALAGPIAAHERLRRTIAPETRGGSGPSADLWGMACLALEALTGALPPGETALATLGAIGVEIGRLLEEDVARRPTSINPLLSALSDAASLPIPDLDPGAVRRPRRPRRTTGAALIESEPPEDDGMTRRVPSRVIDEADTPLDAPVTASALLSADALEMRELPRIDTQRNAAPDPGEERSTDKRNRVDVTERTGLPLPESVPPRAGADETLKTPNALPLDTEAMRTEQLWPSLKKEDEELPTFEGPRTEPAPAFVHADTERVVAIDAHAPTEEAMLSAVLTPPVAVPLPEPRFGHESPFAQESNDVTRPRFATEEPPRPKPRKESRPQAPPVVAAPEPKPSKKPLPRAPRPQRPRTPFEPSPDIKPIPRPRRMSLPPPVNPGDVLFDDSLPAPVPVPPSSGVIPAAKSPLPPPKAAIASTPPPRPPPTPMAGARQHRNLILADSTTAPRAMSPAATIEPPATSAARWLILLIALLLAAIILGVGYYVKLQRDRENAIERVNQGITEETP